MQQRKERVKSVPFRIQQNVEVEENVNRESQRGKRKAANLERKCQEKNAILVSGSSALATWVCLHGASNASADRGASKVSSFYHNARSI